MQKERKSKNYLGVNVDPCEMFLDFRTVKGWCFVDCHGATQKSTKLRVIKQMIEAQHGRRSEIREPVPTGFRAVYERHDGPKTRYLTESERLTLRQCTGDTRSIIVDPVADLGV